MRGSLTKLAVVAQTGNIFAEVFIETERVRRFSLKLTYLDGFRKSKKFRTVFTKFDLVFGLKLEPGTTAKARSSSATW